MPSFANLRLLYGVIFVETGFYRRGIFKFRMDLPVDYPADNARPKIMFLTRLFHPLVSSQTQELDLSPKFPQWKAQTNDLAAVLKYIKQIFYLKDYAPPNATNIDAARMFRSNQKTFLSRVEACVEQSIERRFASFPNCTITFTEHNDHHDIILERVLRSMPTREPRHLERQPEVVKDSADESSLLADESATSSVLYADPEGLPHAKGQEIQQKVTGIDPS